MVITLVLLPALLPGLAGGGAGEVSTGAQGHTSSTELASAHPTTTTTALPTTTTTEPPPTATTAPPSPTTTTTVKRPTTTTTAAPKPKAVPAPTTTTAAPKPVSTTPPIVGNSQTGRATWYEQEPGVCAHRSLPFGTVVTVTDSMTGATVDCTVGDRGPFVSDLIIDLAPTEFSRLASTSVGVLGVTITW